MQVAHLRKFKLFCSSAMDAEDFVNNSPSNGTTTDVRKLASYFSTADYCVFCVMLLASAAIGAYYGYVAKKKKKENSDEFFKAGRSMTAFPIALSLIARSVIYMSYLSCKRIKSFCIVVEQDIAMAIKLLVLRRVYMARIISTRIARLKNCLRCDVSIGLLTSLLGQCQETR